MVDNLPAELRIAILETLVDEREPDHHTLYQAAYVWRPESEKLLHRYMVGMDVLKHGIFWRSVEDATDSRLESIRHYAVEGPDLSTQHPVAPNLNKFLPFMSKLKGLSLNFPGLGGLLRPRLSLMGDMLRNLRLLRYKVFTDGNDVSDREVVSYMLRNTPLLEHLDIDDTEDIGAAKRHELYDHAPDFQLTFLAGTSEYLTTFIKHVVKAPHPKSIWWKASGPNADEGSPPAGWKETILENLGSVETLFIDHPYQIVGQVFRHHSVWHHLRTLRLGVGQYDWDLLKLLDQRSFPQLTILIFDGVRIARWDTVREWVAINAFAPDSPIQLLYLRFTLWRDDPEHDDDRDLEHEYYSCYRRSKHVNGVMDLGYFKNLPPNVVEALWDGTAMRMRERGIDVYDELLPMKDDS